MSLARTLILLVQLTLISCICTAFLASDRYKPIQLALAEECSGGFNSTLCAAYRGHHGAAVGPTANTAGYLALASWLLVTLVDAILIVWA